MQCVKEHLIKLLDGSSAHLIIPVYQRNYDWKTEQCEQLFDDLININKNSLSTHFFGSIVLDHIDGTSNDNFVVDGQQRITTISLLLLAMYRLMHENKVASEEDELLADQIYANYLINLYKKGDAWFRLHPVKKDRVAFFSLFDKQTQPIPNSNMTINFNYFYERIQQGELSIDELFDAINKIEVININLEKGDNSQLIFESLNATGLDLSEGDKIKNLVFMGLPTQLQSEFYDKYWDKIETYTDYDVSMFVRNYLSVRYQQTPPALNKLYFVFKVFVQKNFTSQYPSYIEAIEMLLKDLLYYAELYSILLNGGTENRALNSCIDRLNRLETTVTRPFFLDVLNLWKQGKLSMPDVKEIFLTTENYIFRRTICDLPSNSLNKIFSALHREIIQYDGTDKNYLEKFKFALISKKDRVRCPDDGEFVTALASRKIYNMKNNNIYVLERFENAGTVETHDVYDKVDAGDYSIEHVMPQNLNAAWRRELGDNYKSIHATWLHRLANLTLTGYNSQYSNCSFLEKRDMQNGLRDSHIYMNVWISQQNHWGLKELQERNDKLMQQALIIWPMPKTSYNPAIKQVDSCTLDDDIELVGRKIVKFGYKDIEQPVGSWIDMLLQVVKTLHDEDKSVLFKLAYSNDESKNLKTFVSSDPEAFIKPFKIDNGIFIEKNTSTSQKMASLRKLFNLYGANPQDLVFFLKDAKNN